MSNFHSSNYPAEGAVRWACFSHQSLKLVRANTTKLIRAKFWPASCSEVCIPIPVAKSFLTACSPLNEVLLLSGKKFRASETIKQQIEAWVVGIEKGVINIEKRYEPLRSSNHGVFTRRTFISGWIRIGSGSQRIDSGKFWHYHLSFETNSDWFCNQSSAARTPTTIHWTKENADMKYAMANTRLEYAAKMY